MAKIDGSIGIGGKLTINEVAGFMKDALGETQLDSVALEFLDLDPLLSGDGTKTHRLIIRIELADE